MERKKGFFAEAIVSLILGITGLIVWIVPVFGIAVSSIGLTLGVKSLEKEKKIALLAVILSGTGLVFSLGMGLINAYYVFEDYSLSGERYIDHDAGFSIYPPDGWEAGENKDFGVDAFFREKKSGASVNIIRQQLNTEVGLEEYSEEVKKEFSRIFSGYKPIEEEDLTLKGREAKIIKSYFSNEGTKGMQLIVISDNTAFVIAGTAKEDDWERYKDLLKSSILSFELI